MAQALRRGYGRKTQTKGAPMKKELADYLNDEAEKTKQAQKAEQEKLDAAIRDKLADRGISRDWMKDHLIIIKG
jgi:hypothetical protein